MNYYEKLIQEKNNARDYDDINRVYKEAKRIVDDLRRKYREISGRERDDGNFLYSIIEEKGMPTDSSDRQKARHAAGLLESARRMSTAPRDWGNSKGETNMGYYADLIKEKQNAKPFYTPGLPTKELKTRAEVERYMFEQRREVDKIINWMESTKKKIQEIEKEPKPHDIDWAQRLGEAQSSYKQYKRWMEMHEDFAARAKDWLDKNRNSKDNSKEEKDNAYAKLVKKLPDFDIYEDAEGYFMRVKDGKVVKGGYLSIGDAETDGHRAKSASKDNEKGYYEQIIEQKNSFEEEYSKLMFKMKRMQSDPKTTWSQMENLNREISELKKKYGKPNNYRMTNEKRNFGDEVLIEKKSFGEYWYSIYQTKNKMILRVYTPYGMYYIDDIRDLADGRNEAQRTIDIVKKAGRYV